MFLFYFCFLFLSVSFYQNSSIPSNENTIYCLKTVFKEKRMFTLRKKPEIRARLMFVQLSWQPKAGGETGSSIRCITPNSSARMTTANRKAA